MLVPNDSEQHHITSLQYRYVHKQQTMIKKLYNHLQEVINKVYKKDILITKGDWNSKVGTEALTDWKNYCGTAHSW